MKLKRMMKKIVHALLALIFLLQPVSAPSLLGPMAASAADESEQPAAESVTVMEGITPSSDEPEDSAVVAVVLDNTKASTIDLEVVAEEVNDTSVQSMTEEKVVASLATDKPDYAPTDTAVITGKGFVAGQEYTLIVSSSDEPATSKEVQVTADEHGVIVYAYQLDGNYRPNYTVVIKNADGEKVAETTFTDAKTPTTTTLNTVSTPIISGSTGNTWSGSVSPSNVPSGIDVELRYLPSVNNCPASGGSGTLLSTVQTTTGGTYSGSFSAPTAGTYKFYARFKGNNNYADSNSSCQTITINVPSKIDQNITFDALSNKTFGDADFSVSASASSGLAVSFSAAGNCSVSGTTVHLTGAGSCTVTAQQAGNDNYNPALDVAQSFTISKATSSVNVTCPSTNQSYTAAAQTPCTAGYTTSDGLSGVLTPTYTNNTNAGAATADATYPGDANHESGSGSATFAITPIDARCTIEGYAGTYDGNAHGATGSCTGIGGEDAGSLDLGASFIDVPGGTANWVFTGNGNYNDKSGSVLIEIGKAAATITLDGLQQTYDGTPKVVSVTTEPAELVVGVTYDGTVAAPINAGSYEVVATVNDPNYGGSVSDTLVIDKADAKINITPYDDVYDGNVHTAVGTATGVESPDPADLTSLLDLSGTTHTDAGDYTDDTWTFAGNENYNDASGIITDTIEKAEAQCDIQGYSGTYDGNTHGATGACSGIGGEAAGNLELGASFNDVPGGTAHWTFTGNGNYNDQNGNVEITIAKADATIDVQGYQETYDGDAHGATGTAKGVNDEDLSGSLDLGETFTNVPGGTAHWTFTGGTNYNNAEGDASIVIDQSAAECTITNYEVTYDGTSHSATGVCIGVKGEPLAGLDLSATAHTDAGSYLDTWTFTDVTGNYLDGSDTIIDVINQAESTVTVTCPTEAQTYTGGAQTPCSASVTGAGGLDESLIVSYIDNQNVGIATANATFDGDLNHTPSTGSATFEITKADMTITANDLQKTFGGTLTFAGTEFSVSGLLGSDTVTTASLTSEGAQPAALVGTYDILITDALGTGLDNYNIAYVKGTLEVVNYVWNNFNAPVSLDSKTFKKTSTIPVKFQLGHDPLGNPVSWALARLTLTGPDGQLITPVSSGASNVGNLFRYDPSADQYIFNLSTKVFPKVGAYVLTVDLGDGSPSKTITITVR